MTPQSLNIECALVDGWREAFPKSGEPHPETKRGGILLPYKWVNERTHTRETDLPDYCNSYDAIIPLIQKSFTKSTAHSFFDNLGIECAKETADVDGQYEYQGDGSYYEQWLIFKATPLQLATSLIKALGRYK